MMAIGAFEAGGVVGCVMGGVLADFLMKKFPHLKSYARLPIIIGSCLTAMALLHLLRDTQPHHTVTTKLPFTCLPYLFYLSTSICHTNNFHCIQVRKGKCLCMMKLFLVGVYNNICLCNWFVFVRIQLFIWHNCNRNCTSWI